MHQTIHPVLYNVLNHELTVITCVLDTTFILCCHGIEALCQKKGRIYISNVCSLVFQLDPVSGPVEGGTVVTISGSNLGQRAEDIQNSVQVAGVHCNVIHSRYEVSSRQVAVTTPEHNLLRNISVSIFITVTVFCINLVG